MDSRRRLCLFLAILGVLGGIQSSSALVIEHAQRGINLSAQRVLHSTKLVIKNDGKSTEDTVTICLPALLQQKAAVLDAAQLAGEESKPTRLKAKAGWAVPEGGPKNVACRDYTFASPLEKGETADIMVEAVITKILKPVPAKIKQGESQFMVYSDIAHVVSPYKILKEETNVMLGVEEPESHTAPDPVSISKQTLVMGPYTDIAPFTTTPFYVHYENNFPILEAKTVVREISISHWGNVYFEEQYEIAHNGAKIDGEWSRFDAMARKGGSKAAAPQLPAVIPPESRWIYFRDDIGNISTSGVMRHGNSMGVILIPRFPLFGGWRTLFTFGYSLPLGEIVLQDPKHPGSYALVTSVLPSVKDVVVENLEVRIILPEGARASSVECALPYEPSQEKQYTYFDVLGRTVLVLKLKNVVPESPQGVGVSYTYSPLYLLIKPVVLSAAIALIFAAIVGIGGSGQPTGSKIKTN